MWKCVVFYDSFRCETFRSSNHYLLAMFAKAVVKSKMAFSSIVFDENEVVKFAFNN